MSNETFRLEMYRNNIDLLCDFNVVSKVEAASAWYEPEVEISSDILDGVDDAFSSLFGNA